MELNGSGWVLDLIASMTTDLHKDVRKWSKSYFKLLIRNLSISNREEKDIICEICCIIARFHQIKTNSDGTSIMRII